MLYQEFFKIDGLFYQEFANIKIAGLGDQCNKRVPPHEVFYDLFFAQFLFIFIYNGKASCTAKKEQIMAKKVLSPLKTEKQDKKTVKPKRLSKIGKLMKKYPNGIIEVHDLKAVLK